MIRIVCGISEDQRAEVARLFWAAFSEKLTQVLGPEQKALRFLSEAINTECAFCAVDHEGRLLGVAGFKTTEGGMIGGSYRQLSAVYGRYGALWRGALLEFLERDLNARQMLMDGIFVDPDHRGKGVGSKLLEALEAKARREEFSEIRLDVVDENPRARALYERRGFEPVATQNMGPLRYVFGFRASTTMVLRLGP